MRLYVDVFSTFFTGGENHYAVDEGEKGMILAHTNVQTGMVLSAALTLQDVTGTT